MLPYYKIFTAKAPVNIAVIKYWGKSNESLKIPVNDSLSGTLNVDDMCATTSIAISDTFSCDELWLNGIMQNLSDESSAKILLGRIRSLSGDKEIINYKAHIVSYNNFPTAAGLASSAAGYACLAYVLGNAYGLTDLSTLSKIARIGSGSACRSLFGGFVEWIRGHDHESSVARQVADHEHWPEMKVIICIVNDKQKEISSSKGMLLSVETSSLIKHRAEQIVPERITAMKEAISHKDFETFATLTMQDSNQFHAICLDTFPPIFYLNDVSRNIIKLCSIINAHYGQNKAAYTFDAGPNACIYLLDSFVDQFIAILKCFFPLQDKDNTFQDLPVKGTFTSNHGQDEVDLICDKLKASGFKVSPNSLSYLISTSIGKGPLLVDEHIDDINLKPEI